MADFIEAIESPFQKTGEYWQQASAALARYPEPEIITALDGETRYITTPPIKVDTTKIEGEPFTEAEKRLYEKTFAIAARTDSDKYHPDLPLYLIINGNYTNPLMQFQRNFTGVTLMDDSFSELSAAEKYLPSILEAVDEQVNREVRTYNWEQEAAKTSRRWRLAGKLFAVAALGGAIAGGGILWSNKVANDAAVEQVRVEYDQDDIDIDSIAVRAGDLDFIESNLGFFGREVPEPGENESYEHPRKLTMDTAACLPITKINPDKESVQAVTDASNERLFTVVNSAGEVQVCYFGSTSDVNGDKPRVAFQIVGLQ